jgi:hypothetical protein
MPRVALAAKDDCLDLVQHRLVDLRRVPVRVYRWPPRLQRRHRIGVPCIGRGDEHRRLACGGIPGAAAGSPKGTRTVKQLPLPDSLRTAILLPIDCEPRALRESETRVRLAERLEHRACCCDVMPMESGEIGSEN